MAQIGPGIEGVAMFALLAVLCFVLALFDVHIGSINLVVLGLAFIAVHLMWGWAPWAKR